ncbi:plastocyanin/azurin family copper-binding protein [Prosthecobacter dejongeii]|uniref:Azurin n=1 Tax=Prosthecobacter dejongeii TaxID=48465 RepID=A0A7W8DPR4_9BACT|nr:plastocyanin/azurin family copper-binding protein [Prosthecobacter dejongeii]MBB5037592.1 azurin [Prosthecobacter dejongeii]
MSAHSHSPSEESGSIWKILNVIIAFVVGGFTLFWGATLLIGARNAAAPKEPVAEVATAPAAPAAEAPPAPATTPAAAAPVAAAPVAAAAPAAPAPVAGPAAEITIKPDTANPLAYDLKEFNVKAGQKVKITFNNTHPAVPQMHNIVIGTPGSKDKLMALAMQMVAAPDGMAKGYIPEGPEVLFHTKLLQPNQTEVLEFTAPAAGDYPYLCTFPGHGAIMNGVMHVE